MTYEISGEGNNKIKFNLIVIYHSSTEDKTDIFTDDELRNNPYYDNVTDYDKVELFVDYKRNDYSHIDEVFTVKVKLQLKEGEKNKSGLGTGGKLGIGGGAIGSAIIIGGLIFCCCCCKSSESKSRPNKDKSEGVIMVVKK